MHTYVCMPISSIVNKEHATIVQLTNQQLEIKFLFMLLFFEMLYYLIVLKKITKYTIATVTVTTTTPREIC